MKKLILADPLIIMISLVVATMLLLMKCWAEGIVIFVFAFVLNWWSETFALNFFRKKTENYDFRVLTYNINRAHEISVNNGTTEELIEFILKQNSDIVLLQEYNAELYPMVQKQLSLEYPYSSVIDITSRFKSVYSRFPIDSCEQMMVDASKPKYELFQNAIYCKKQHNGLEVLPICKLLIRIGDQRLQLFNCHLMSNNYSVVIRNLKRKKKNLLHGIFPILHRIDFGYQARNAQVKVIGENMDSMIPTLVCGDMNDIGGSSPLKILQRYGLSDAWWRNGLGFGFTFHGMGLRFRLDHILFQSKCLYLQNVKVPHSDASDHSPIICDFTFKKIKDL